MIGKTILHYEILEKLGGGGMGVVYKAQDTKLDRIVALKFLPPHLLADKESEKRFISEAKAASSFDHPNICTIHDINKTEDNQFYIVMGYYKGETLKKKLESRPLQINTAITYAVQIAAGLGRAHEAGIVHRDIKPENIIITDRDEVKILDFGLAKTSGDPSITKLGSTVGTVSYMSPEQTKGENVDQRTDIWSLGVVLYQMLSGSLPFKGDYDQAIIYSILNEDPPLLNAIPENLEKILNKALQKNPKERYNSADEFADDLSKITESRSINTDPKQSNRPWILAGSLAILIAFVLYLFIPSSNKVEQYNREVVKRIAVLPFLDLSPQNDQEYFSDGLSEELLNVLAQNTNLQVTSRTSSFSFKRKEVDIKTIASKLNVNYILEGSIRKAGNSLRITTQLINTDTDVHIWSKIYDGTLENIFSLQDSISGSVVEALNIALLDEKSKPHKRVTNPEAYNAYLQGKYFFSLRRKENYEKAIDYYKQSISIDSSFARAWLGLSKVHSDMADKGYLPVDESYSKARQEITKALELDPKLADAHSQMGWIKRAYDWDWIGADEYYRRARELEPGNASIITNSAVLDATLGRLDDAINLTRHSIELNPLSTSRYNNLGYLTLYAGLFNESDAAFRKALELNPQYPGGHLQVGLVYLVQGKFDLALDEIKKETDPFWQMFGFALVYHSLGKNKEADEVLAEIINEDQDDSAYQIAEIYAYRGETDKAFDWLERAYLQRDSGLPELKTDTLLRNIVKDPRYAAFLEKMKLPL